MSSLIKGQKQMEKNEKINIIITLPISPNNAVIYVRRITTN